MTFLTWIPRLLWFGLWYAWILVVSNMTVIWDNLTPGQGSRPGIARLDSWCKTDTEVTVLAILIMLTPGTLALGAATREDGLRVLYVHGMYADTADDLRRDLRGLERRMLNTMRRTGFAESGSPPAAVSEGGAA